MSNTTCPKQNLNVKHVVTLFEEVQNRYVNKLLSIDEKHITADERHKVNIHFFLFFLGIHPTDMSDNTSRS